MYKMQVELPVIQRNYSNWFKYPPSLQGKARQSGTLGEKFLKIVRKILVFDGNV